MIRAGCALALRRQALAGQVLRPRLIATSKSVPSAGVKRLIVSGIRHTSSDASSTSGNTTLSTLNPAKLTPAEYLDWAGQEVGKLEFPFAKATKANANLVQTCVSTRYDLASPSSEEDADPTVFPDNARGFLYAYKPADVESVLAYELRLRVTEDSHPASFESGQDLIGPDGVTPWSMPFLGILGKTDESSLKSVLVADEMMTLHQVRKLADAALELGTSQAPVLHSLGQQFVVNLAKPVMRVFIVGKHDLFEAPLALSTLESSKDKKERLFAGKIKVSFEQSMLEEHQGTRTLVVRVHDVVEPVELLSKEYKGKAVLPTPGELLAGRSDKVWSVNVDKLSTVFAQASRYLLIGRSATPVKKVSKSNPKTSKPPAQEEFGSVGKVVTLSPPKLEHSDFQDWSGESSPSFKLIRPPGVPKPLAETKFVVPTPPGFVFPEGSHGFLYLYDPQVGSPFARTVRMRLTETDDPDGFDAGESDLIGPDGQTWAMSIMKLFGTKPGDSLAKRLLMKDGELTKAEADLLARSASSSTLPIVYKLGEPFTFKLGSTTSVRMIEKHALVTAPMPAPTKDYPYKGTVTAAFETSDLEEHENRRVLVLRVLHVGEYDVVESEDADEDHGVPPPQEGKLLNWTEEDVWAIDVDQNRSKMAQYARPWFGKVGKPVAVKAPAKKTPVPKVSKMPKKPDADSGAALGAGFKTELQKIRKSLAHLERAHFEAIDEHQSDIDTLTRSLQQKDELNIILARQRNRR